MKEPQHDMVSLTLRYPQSRIEYTYLGLKVGGRWHWTGARPRLLDGPWDRMSNWVGNKRATVIALVGLAPIETPAPSGPIPWPGDKIHYRRVPVGVLPVENVYEVESGGVVLGRVFSRYAEDTTTVKKWAISQADNNREHRDFIFDTRGKAAAALRFWVETYGHLARATL